MSESTFPCPSCGGPNPPQANQIRMKCVYCGSMLTIPEDLRVKAAPKLEKNPSKPKQVPGPQVEAGDVLRKVQPIAIRAWNLYAMWTWGRWILPGCLAVFIIGFAFCLLSGLVPVIIGMGR